MEKKLDFKGIIGLKQMLDAITSNNLFIPQVKGESFCLKIDENITSLDISLVGSEYFTFDSLAILALLMRSFALKKIHVNFKWSSHHQGNESSIHRYLRNCGFFDLFSSNNIKQDWIKEVKFSPRSLSKPQLETTSNKLTYEQTRYTPLQWYDESNFAYHLVDNNYEIVQPELKVDEYEKFQTLLTYHGFIDIQQIEIFSSVIFAEIAWNTVLHSNEIPGEGFGIWGAQIFRKPKSRAYMKFIIADLGRSIPCTLHTAYSHSGRDYEKDSVLWKNAAIVRYAFDYKSTSRTKYPSKIAEEGYRGLALVQSTIQNGTMELISNGGMISLQRINEDFRVNVKPGNYLDSSSQIIFPGTFVIGEFFEGKTKKIIQKNTNATQPPVISNLIINLFDHKSGPLSKEVLEYNLSNYLPKIKYEESITLDVGYVDSNLRILEEIINCIIPKLKNKFVCFWNILTDLSLFENIILWLETENKDLSSPILFINKYNSCAVYFPSNIISNYSSGQIKEFPFVHFEKTEEDRIFNDVPFFRASIGINDFIRIQEQINTHYIKTGFKTSTEEAGFFYGNIHLLSGSEIPHYFCLNKNINERFNLLRWRYSLGSALSKIISENNLSLQSEACDTLVIGSSGPIRKIIQNNEIILNYHLPTYTLATYDIPTKEELYSIIEAFKNIIIISDVISTGSWIGGILELLKNEEKNIIGIISLVDIEHKHTSDFWRRYLNASRNQHIYCSKINLNDPDFEISKNQRVPKNYWIEPISEIPSEKNIFLLDIEERINRSIELIENNPSAKILHIIDGTRHSNVFIDIYELITKDEGNKIYDAVNNEIKRRLAERNWSKDFYPQIIIYPSSVSRIQALYTFQDENRPIISQSSTYEFVLLLKKIWPKLFEIEVDRAFEPSGASRCSPTINFEKNKLNFDNREVDIIIADDGIWSGKTVESLINITVGLGVTRIMVIPLFARFSPHMLKYLESIRSINNSDKEIDICYVFPIVLPLPFYSSNDCPIDLTIERLNRWNDNRYPIKKYISEIIKSLKGSSPAVQNKKNQLFVIFWIRLRIHLEIASESEAALSKTISLIENAKAPEEMDALLNIFISEWHLISKARLRQSLSSIVSEKCKSILKTPELPISVRINAMTLIRSQFVDLFIEEINLIGELSLTDLTILERFVVHLYTLKDRFKMHVFFIENMHRLINSLKNRVIELSSTDGKELERWIYCLNILENILIDIKLNSQKTVHAKEDMLIKICNLIYQDPWHHDVPGILEFFSKDTGGQLSGKVYRTYASYWEQYFNRFVDEYLPLFDSLKDFLLILSTPNEQLPSFDFNYLVSRRESEESFCLIDDLNSVTSSLQFLITNPKSAIFLQAIQQSATRLLKSIFGEESYLLSIIKSLSSYSVNSLLNEMKENIENKLSIRKNTKIIPEIILNISSELLHKHIFAPIHILDRCRINILSNLEKHAFKEIDIAIKYPQIAIIVESAGDTNLIEISVHDNGAELNEEITIGDETNRTNREMEVFGGKLSPPRISNVPGYNVNQKIIFLIWSGVINE